MPIISQAISLLSVEFGLHGGVVKRNVNECPWEKSATAIIAKLNSKNNRSEAIPHPPIIALTGTAARIRIIAVPYNPLNTSGARKSDKK